VILRHRSHGARRSIPPRRIAKDMRRTLQMRQRVSAAHSFAAHLSNPSSFVIQPMRTSRSFPGSGLLLRSIPVLEGLIKAKARGELLGAKAQKTGRRACRRQ